MRNPTAPCPKMHEGGVGRVSTDLRRTWPVLCGFDITAVGRNRGKRLYIWLIRTDFRNVGSEGVQNSQLLLQTCGTSSAGCCSRNLVCFMWRYRGVLQLTDCGILHIGSIEAVDSSSTARTALIKSVELCMPTNEKNIQ